MTFKYQIGDYVANKGLLEVELMEMANGPSTPRRQHLRVIEKISCECIGGTQLFYQCEATDGYLARFSEDSLIPGLEAFSKWIEGFMAQQDRLKPKDRKL